MPGSDWCFIDAGRLPVLPLLTSPSVSVYDTLTELNNSMNRLITGIVTWKGGDILLVKIMPGRVEGAMV